MWACLNNFLPPEEFFDYPLQFPKLKVINITQFQDVPGRSSQSHRTGRSTKHSKKSESDVKSSPKPVKPPTPTPEEIKFNEVSKGKPHITPDEAAYYVRLFGGCPTNDDILKLQKKHGQNITRDIAIKWIKDIEEKYEEVDLASDMKHIFLSLDSLRDEKMTGQQVFTLLTSYGDALTEEEAHAVLKLAGVTSLEAEVNCEEFCALLSK